MYHIRWENFGPEEDTWEEESNLHCPDILEEFEKNYQKKQSVSKTAQKAPKKKTKRKRKKKNDDKEYIEKEAAQSRRSNRKKKLKTYNLNEFSDEEELLFVSHSSSSGSTQDDESNGWTCTSCRLYDDSNDKLQCSICQNEYHRLCVQSETEESVPKALSKNWTCSKCVGYLFIIHYIL